MKFKRTLCTLSASTLMLGCAVSTKPSPGGPSPLVIASCPKLAPLADPSFGATTAKLVEVGNQYRDCRTAALAGGKVDTDAPAVDKKAEVPGGETAERP